MFLLTQSNLILIIVTPLVHDFYCILMCMLYCIILCMLRCIYIVCIYILCMLCCIYCVRYTVLIAICVYVLFYSGKEERLQPIARSLNYKSNQIKSYKESTISLFETLYEIARDDICVVSKKMVGVLDYNERTGAKTICELMLIANALFAESVSWLMAQFFVSSTVHVC